MARSSSKAQHTRAFIIEKTASVFNKKGYAGTSLTDLTRATGLTKGALYGNFRNKDEIALAVYDYNVRKLQGAFLARPDNLSGNAVERLLSIPEFYKNHFGTIAAQGGCPILNTAVEADDNQPLLKKKVIRTINTWKKNLVTTIREGMDAGIIRPDIDPSKYACVFIALFEGGIMLSKITGDISFINHALDRMTEMIEVELRR